jgi:hypothetical protein
MEIKSKHNKITEYQLTHEEWMQNKLWLRQASLSQTMGPNWKNIFWSPIGRPYVKLNNEFIACKLP